jgi:mono/diheme cytochrome c family protein
VLAQAGAQPSRGQLLYDTHCVACHDTQVHWRDARAATDWRSLKAEVRRWQARALLDWSEADIVQVTRHLNERIYRFAQTEDLVGLSHGPGPTR